MPALQRLACESALLDGEIAVADAEGHTDFGALQDALSTGEGALTYYLFDLLELDGEDLRRPPADGAQDRSCAHLLKGVEAPLIYSDHVVGNGDEGVRAGLRDEARRPDLETGRRAVSLRPHPDPG